MYFATTCNTPGDRYLTKASLVIEGFQIFIYEYEGVAATVITSLVLGLQLVLFAV